MKKRLLSFLLCLAILAGQIPAAAFAAEDTPPTEPAAAETILDEQNATETPAPAAEEAPETQQPAPTGEAAPEQTPDQQPTQQPETEGSEGAEAAPTPEGQPVPPPPENVADQGEAQPEQQPAEGAGPADANSEETEEQPGDSVVTYTITFTDELGTASDETGSEITQAAEGTLVTITAKDRAEEGLLFTAWQAPEGLELADDTEEITTFTMPDSNVELAAEYAPLPEDAEALAEEEEIMLADASGVTGSGIESDPFVVTTYKDLKEKMELTGDKYIQLGADIDTSTMYGGYGLGSNEFVSAIGRSYLDLNGKKLTFKKSIIESGGEIQFIRVTAGELIIKDSVGSGEIVGVNNVTRRYMRLIDVVAGAKLTLNSGRLHLETTPDNDVPNATICSMGTVEINGGTVSISKFDGRDEVTGQINMQNFALETINSVDGCYALINGGTFDGRVMLSAVAKDSGVADNVITGGDFKKSIFIRKDKNVTGDVPLNVSIQGGTYHYTPGYYTHPANAPVFPGRKASDPENLFQFATVEFREKGAIYDGAVYSAFPGESPDFNYDMNAFASMFPKNAIITAEGQEYDHLDVRDDEPQHISVGDAAFTGSSSALDLAHLVNSHYKTITVTTIPETSLTNMKLTVGSDGTPLPAQGTSTVSGDVTLGSDGTLTKTVYITALGNKQLKEMFYSNPSKIDFGYRLNIFKDGVRVTDYTGDSLTYAALGDEISVSVQLRDFKFEEGVYTIRLALWPYLRGSEAQLGETLVGLWKLTAEKPAPAPVAHSIKIINGFGTATPKTAIAGETITVKADDRTANEMMFTQWYTDTPGVTFADVTQRETTFTMPDCDVKVNPGFQYVSFTKQPIDSWPQVNHAGKAYVTFSAPITKWELMEGNTTVASSGNLFINTGNPITVDIPAQSSEVEKTYTVVVTANGQKFSSNEFKVKWVSWPQAPAVEFTPADGTQFVGEIEVIASDALYAGEEIFEIAYTTDGTDPKTSTATIYANTDTEHITLTETTTIKARTYNADATADAEKWGPLATATFTKYSDSTLPKPTITPESTTYTGSITAYLTAPALDGVSLEYCLMQTGDPSTIGSWVTYDPETGITVNEFGTITLYARTFKNVDAETPDGKYYVEHLTSENVSATYTRTYSAAIDNVTVSGKFGETLTQDVVIRMNGDRFENVTAGDDVSGWFNLPAGLTAKVKALSDANGYHRTLTVTISGTPTATSADEITVTIPKDKLLANGTADLTVLSNPKAVYNIGTDAVHTHIFGEWTMLNNSLHSRSCTCGEVQFEAHDFSAWNNNGDGTHSRHCNVCKKSGETANYTETATHNWQWVVDTVATPNAAGKKHEECTDCGIKQNENTEIPMMTSIKVENLTIAKPAKDAAAAAATTTDSAYTVTNTQWKAANGTTLAVGEKFKPGTVYTASITLHSKSDAVFSANSTFNAIDGKSAAVAGGALTGDSHAYSIVLTYTFDATEGVHQHTYGAWSSDDTHHWHECTDASCPNKSASIADKAEHTFVWKIDVPASQASTGTKHEECKVCGKKRSENTVIDKLPSSSSGSHHSSNNSNNNNNTGTEAAAPEAAAPAPAASAPVTTTTSARTGDSSNLIGWLAVLLISGGAAGAWYTVAKKKKEQ